MSIEWRGEGCFETKSIGDKVSLMTEIPSRDSGISAPRKKTDIYISIWSDLSDSLFGNESDDRFLISGPGEYEVKDIFIKGVKISKIDNVMKSAYLIELEGIRIAYLGEVNNKDINQEWEGLFEGVDILILPVGDKEFLNSQQAAGIINQIEPKIIIPSHYSIPESKIKYDKLDSFLKEMGVGNVEVENKLLIKKKDLNFEGVKIVPLKVV